jgi:hypothetical protein
MTPLKLSLTALALVAGGGLLSGCLAVAVGTVAGTAIGVTGAAVGMTAKGVGMAAGAIIPGGDDDKKRQR